jgi:agmatinase
MSKIKHPTFEQTIKQLEEGLPAPRHAGFLGASFKPEESKLVLIPVPWEATTSYGGGTSKGPAAIAAASHQLDTEDAAFGKAYRAGIAFVPEDPVIKTLNKSAKSAAGKVIAALEEGKASTKQLELVNNASVEVNHSVYKTSKKWLDKKHFVGVVGGDHASPQGLIKALADIHTDGFGVLHFDAHHDLRNAYEGFTYSHASIFYNVMSSYRSVRKLVQVGIRDYSREEKNYMDALISEGRGACFYGRDIFTMKAEGTHFKSIATSIVESLPKKVYVSFDIDALDPSYCPSTGTPVPGGLSYDEACFILDVLASSGRQVIGFDLCEVAPDPDGNEWDANVGARMLYKLCGCLLKSQKLC